MPKSLFLLIMYVYENTLTFEKGLGVKSILSHRQLKKHPETKIIDQYSPNKHRHLLFKF